MSTEVLLLNASLVSFSPELVDKTKTSNQMHSRMIKKKIFNEKHAPQARLIKQNAPLVGSTNGYLVL